MGQIAPLFRQQARYSEPASRADAPEPQVFTMHCLQHGFKDELFRWADKVKAGD